MNKIIHGDSSVELKNISDESVNLIFTSPPYYNAKPEYAEFHTYEDYLNFIKNIIRECYRVLSEGRFFVINIAPVLVKRSSRSDSSKRIALPFDVHQLFIQENFEFIDDIIWMKPEGAGWASNRGRRFYVDRNPLQYKTVPVTEYVLVYRKRTSKLIDWNIRNHNQDLVKKSKILDDYERTNVWKISPASASDHPAVFPYELAEKVIKYYSFVEDTVLDPFAGSGTVGEAAVNLNRKFILIERKPEYINSIRRKLKTYF